MKLDCLLKAHLSILVCIILIIVIVVNRSSIVHPSMFSLLGTISVDASLHLFDIRREDNVQKSFLDIEHAINDVLQVLA